MQNQSLKPDQSEESPLDMLLHRFDADMKNVNDLIVENMQSSIPLIPKLAQYLIAAGGKRIRPLLILASTALFDGPMEKAYHLAAAVEFIHTATLLHDDVVDESKERRGQKAANLIFGNQASVLVGDFLFSKSFQMMVESGSLDILRILSNAAAIIAEGEVLQLSAANDIKIQLPTYLNIIESKTAALFAASCEVGAVLSKQDKSATNAMHTYGMKLGTAFQIIDDALDYSADHQKLGKNVGDDFKEGKITAPILFALENSSEEEENFWSRTIGQKMQNETDFDTAMNIIVRHNALDKTIALARQYAVEAQKALTLVPANPLKDTLYDLTDYTITRCS